MKHLRFSFLDVYTCKVWSWKKTLKRSDMMILTHMVQGRDPPWKGKSRFYCNLKKTWIPKPGKKNYEQKWRNCGSILQGIMLLYITNKIESWCLFLCGGSYNKWQYNFFNLNDTVIRSSFWENGVLICHELENLKTDKVPKRQIYYAWN